MADISSLESTVTESAADNGQDQTITATQVPEHQRLNFLPRVFGPRLALLGESAVFDWMGHLCPDYSGGYWQFFDLSNGGFFMALDEGSCPTSESTPLLRISVEGNGYTGTLSAEAAGVLVTLFALNHLLFAGHHGLIDAYDALTDFARQHPEVRAITRALD